MMNTAKNTAKIQRKYTIGTGLSLSALHTIRGLLSSTLLYIGVYSY
jgi:hypothetical protein